MSSPEMPIPGKPAAPAASVAPYNFLRPPRISRDRRATLEALYGRFAASFQAQLSSRLRSPADVVLTAVDQATFGEYILSLPTPCAAFVFELGNGTEGVLNMGTDFSMFIVDRLFGGPGEVHEVDRTLTQLERLVVKGVTDRTLILLGEAWRDHMAFEPVLVAFESLPEVLQIANQEDNVLVTHLAVHAGAFSGTVSVCIPLLALEPFLQEKPMAVRQTARATDAERAESRSRIESSLRVAHVPVTARFPLVHLRARDVATLTVGQVIRTGFAPDVPLEVHVNGRRRFLGAPGHVRRTVGIRITQVCPTGQAEPNGRATRAKVV
jgi:flagellar motor switch protein FliM